MYNCKWLLILISFNYCPLLGGELAWTSNVYLKSFVMNSVQVNYCQSVEDTALQLCHTACVSKCEAF